VIGTPPPHPAPAPRTLPSVAAIVLLALVAPPGSAEAGGPEVEALALATLRQTGTLAGGSLIGPTASRATWFSLGGVRPFDGEAMALFSTGVVDTALLPGTDLAAVGPDDDVAGVNFSLSVPAGMRSLRFAVRMVAPPESRTDPASVLDRVRVEVSGDPQSLDPWLLGDLFPDSAGLRPDTEGLLDGTRYEGAWLTDWIEAVVPVQPLTQIPVSFQVRDGGGDARGDLVMLLDGIRFDGAVPLAVPPGIVPSLSRVTPSRLPDGLASELLMEGDELPRDLAVALVNDEGVPVLELGATNVDWRSRERVVATIPALEPSTVGLRIEWADGASLTWPGALRIDTPPPSIAAVRPDVSPPEGGGLAVLEGDGFFDVSSLRVGDTDVDAFTVLDSGRIELVVPPGEPGLARLLVIAAGGSVERTNGILYAAPADGPAPADPVPGGPTVASCTAAPGQPSGPTAALGLLGLGLALVGVRRRP
jgi:MYXO-CTERM domain-containing protein